jgi:hypothetical protein
MKGKGGLLSGILCAAIALAACQTVPVNGPREAAAAPVTKAREQAGLPSLHPLAPYENRHGIAFRYPRAWHIEDATLNYQDLDAAAAEGGAYVQVYSYDRATVADPATPVPAREAKIMISMMRNEGKLDYPQLLAGLGDDIIDRAAFMIGGRQAWKVHYRILNQESGGRIEILSIFLIDQGFITRFICYPWNSRYEAQFEELAESFRSRRK